MAELSRSAREVAAALAERNIDTTVQELPDSTRSARDAAAALGCELAQITKSLVFREVASDRPVLVLASGPDRVDESKLADLLGGAVEQAQAAWVKQRTGFAVGGVPPLGHTEPLTTFIDERLLRHDTVWAAAGTPRAVFPAAPRALAEAAKAEIVSLVR
ncbi:YbaK/EbsC family protein [Saccharopolyspora rosea]|uniref:YbaK/EbsC family protein n=1 Tax=Saccharopolyspora rosea TaxID=524884 RepID=A0ABW3FV45_9PSEU